MKLIDITKIKPNSYNPNVVEDKVMAQLVSDVGRIGIQHPVLVRPDGDGFIIVDGEHRWRAASELKMKEVACVVLEIQEHEAMVMTISMNRLRGEFDQGKLADILNILSNHYGPEELSKLLGYEEAELKSYVALADFDFEAVAQISKELGDNIPLPDMKESPLDLLSEFLVPVSFKEMDVITSCLSDGKKGEETDGNTLARLFEDILKVSWPDKHVEVLSQKSELNNI